MDNELHYISYDPDAIWQGMMEAYVAAGGDVLYPGNEKEMLLRGVQLALIQAFAVVDTALRMDTLAGAVREYLDEYGQKRFCSRIREQAATCTVEIVFENSGISRTIPAGTALTADGTTIYLTQADIRQSGLAETVTASIICQQAGSHGNGLLAGTQMQLMNPNQAVLRITTTENAAGGQEAEDDETYRERIRTYGLSSTTTGPKERYEAVAKAVSSDIIDAEALKTAAGEVGVYLIVKDEETAAALIMQVEKALSPENERPLTDHVTVQLARKVPYKINVQCELPEGTNLQSVLEETIRQYQAEQDGEIGRAFDPYRLMADLYQAGAARVIFAEGSHINGSALDHTRIDKDAHCVGEIELEVIGT